MCRALGWLHCAEQSPVLPSPSGNRQLCCLLQIHHWLSLPQNPPPEISVTGLSTRSCWGVWYPQCPAVCSSGLIALNYCDCESAEGQCRQAGPCQEAKAREGQGPWLTSPLPPGHCPAAELSLLWQRLGPSLIRIICILPLPLSLASLLLCTTEIPALVLHPLLPLMLFTFKC